MLTATKRNVANHTNVNECEAVYSDTGTSERSQHKAALCAKQEPGEKRHYCFCDCVFWQYVGMFLGEKRTA